MGKKSEESGMTDQADIGLDPSLGTLKLADCTESQTQISFTVPGQPVAKGRPKIGSRNGQPMMYAPERTVSYESTVKLFAAQAMRGRPLITGPVRLVMNVALQIPASWSGKKQRAARTGESLPTGKPDADNVIKMICDALNGVVWKDDTQVVNIDMCKRYSDEPGVRVRVHQINWGKSA
jgi:Holliday junction resolvase RusA-like endonuclease